MYDMWQNLNYKTDLAKTFSLQSHLSSPIIMASEQQLQGQYTVYASNFGSIYTTHT